MKKLIYSLVFLVSLTALLADGTEPSGTGTEADPYQIVNLDNLLWVSTNDQSWDKYFIQTADFDASDTENWNDGAGFSPIGIEQDNPFTGHYDGQEHTISNLHINRPSQYYNGLLAYINNAEITNLGVENIEMIGDQYTGGLVGYSSGGTIINCYSSGNVTGNEHTGGLVGSNYGAVLNSFWDTETSGQTSSDGGTGKTTAEMKNNLTFTDLNTEGLDEPWDFVGNFNDDTASEDIWDIDPEINSGYPYLSDNLVAVDDHEENQVIDNINLKNYPNPFYLKAGNRNRTTIEFSLPTDSEVKISVYNIKGQKVKTIAADFYAKGKHAISWNGSNNNGKEISSGVYFYKLKTNNRVKYQKAFIIK